MSAIISSSIKEFIFQEFTLVKPKIKKCKPEWIGGMQKKKLIQVQATNINIQNRLLSMCSRAILDFFG